MSGRCAFSQINGICLDAEGAVRVSSFMTGEILRVQDGGEVTGRIPVPVAARTLSLALSWSLSLSKGRERGQNGEKGD